MPGNAWLNVEEYKRPKFQVTLDVPKTAARLGGEIQLEGKAIAYTGASVGGAKIRYHVVRQVRYPDWWYWCFAWRVPQQSGWPEMAHGTAETQADGSFTIRFIAKPDLSVPREERAGLPVPGLGRRDGYQRRNPLRRGREHSSGRLHGLAGVAQRQRLAHGRHTGQNQAHDDHARRRAAKVRRGAENLPPQAAGKSAGRPDILGPRQVYRAAGLSGARKGTSRRLPSPIGRGAGGEGVPPTPQTPTPGTWGKSLPNRG